LFIKYNGAGRNLFSLKSRSQKESQKKITLRLSDQFGLKTLIIFGKVKNSFHIFCPPK